MKKFITLTLLSILLSTSIYANPYKENFSCGQDSSLPIENNLYVNGFAGANFLQAKYIKSKNLKTGYVLSAALGYRLNYGFRVEGEYAFRRNSIKQQHRYLSVYRLNHMYAQTSSYMVNALWDVPLSKFCLNIHPFIGGGIGYDSQGLQHSYRGSKYISTTTRGQFAWQFMTGLTYPLSSNTSMMVAYKLHKGEKCTIYNHSIGLGLTYNFGACIKLWN